MQQHGGWLSSIVLLTAINVAASPLPISIDTAPPLGFEGLSVPQTSLVDIYYGDRYLTSQLATFQPGVIQFSAPTAIINGLPSTIDSTKLIAALSGELNSHSALLCQGSETNNCGILQPEIAGVIFNDSTFRADLFIHRDYVTTRKAGVRKYLPPSDADIAFMQNLSGAVSGSNAQQSDNRFNLNGRTIASWRENSLRSQWNYGDDGQFAISELYAQRAFEGNEYNLGLLSTQGFGFNFLSDSPMMGARINSSNNTREDLDYSSGVPVTVFLPTHGRVEVYKDNRLISSRYYEAGAQQLNTSDFPSGAYNIEIRVVNDSGQILSSETQFFAKQSQLPPLNEWLYFMEAGQTVSTVQDSLLPQRSEQWIGRVGLSYRLADTWAVTAAAAMSTVGSLAEVGVFQFGEQYQLNPSVMLSDEGSVGLAFNGQLTLSELSFSGYYRYLHHTKAQPLRTNTSQPNWQSEHLLGYGFRQLQLSAAAPLFGGSLNYRYSQNDSFDRLNVMNGQTKTHNLEYRFNLFQQFNYNGDLEISLSRSDDTSIAMVSLQLNYLGDSLRLRAAPKARIVDRDSTKDRSEEIDLSASWQDRELLAGDLRVDGGVKVGSGTDRLRSGLNYKNRYGAVSLGVNHLFGGSDAATSWSGNMSTSFLSDGASVAIGGEDVAESALLLDLQGSSRDVFDVHVDGIRRGYAVVGEPSAIMLSPYEQYTVALSAAGETLYQFDERERLVTLYPGNVKRLNYEVTALKLLFGRLLFNGEPLKNASISGGTTLSNSDELGMFQLEALDSTKTLTVTLFDQRHCTVTIPMLSHGYVTQMGNINIDATQCEAAALMTQSKAVSR